MVEEAIKEGPAQRDCGSLLYRIIGTSIDFVNLRLIMNRVGILYWHELRLAMKYLKQKYWHEFRHCSRRHSTKINQIKLLRKKNTNRKCSNENEIKNEIKFQ